MVAAYPACNFDGQQEGQYLKEYLGPQLRKAHTLTLTKPGPDSDHNGKDHPDVSIYVHDGQKYHHASTPATLTQPPP